MVALVATRTRRRAQRTAAAALVAYYSAATTFHVLSHDRPADVAPAAVCAAMAAALV